MQVQVHYTYIGTSTSDNSYFQNAQNIFLITYYNLFYKIINKLLNYINDKKMIDKKF